MRASLPTDAPPFPSKQQQQNKQPTLGPDAHPLYKFLKAALPDDAPGAPSPRPRGAEAGAIAWNYTKFLIGRDGAPLARYKPGFDPLEFEGDGAAAGGAFVVVNARGGGGGRGAGACALAVGRAVVWGSRVSACAMRPSSSAALLARTLLSFSFRSCTIHTTHPAPTTTVRLALAGLPPRRGECLMHPGRAGCSVDKLLREAGKVA